MANTEIGVVIHRWISMWYYVLLIHLIVSFILERESRLEQSEHE